MFTPSPLETPGGNNTPMAHLVTTDQNELPGSISLETSIGDFALVERAVARLLRTSFALNPSPKLLGPSNWIVTSTCP